MHDSPEKQDPKSSPPPFAMHAEVVQPTTFEVSSDARTMALLAHLLGLALGFLGPLIIWLTKKDEDAFVDDQAKEALNFQLTMLIFYLVASVVYMVIAFLTCGLGAFLPLPLIPFVLQITFSILAAVSVNNGKAYRYPMNIRMIK